ncbi:MAG TPA: SUMF1/EgtB/PvdO family nonheme iron enzyme [Candidatus Binatia bacterium]|nr:SUMF1/EgtB/PvdO family nonheme iron enzyme [Candidatus Binatia bacterium]
MSDQSPASQQLVGALLPGTRLHEYRIEGLLGHGGFGITYLARDTHLDKPVAIKEYLPGDLAVRVSDGDVTVRSPDTQEAFAWGRHHFLKEARVLARFRHHNLIQVHRFFEAHNTAYFVMEYAQGTTLAALTKNGATLPEDRLRAVLLPVLAGLEKVHAEGVLHRDIKPDNIIVRDDGTPVLIDFGAARQNLNQMTRSILSVLTAGYAPLEQYASDGNQGPWTDLYAIGAVAYRAVTGRKPADAVNRVRNDPLVPASVAAAGRYTPSFLAAIDWALRVDAEDRPRDVPAFRAALEGSAAVPVAGTAPAVAPPVPEDATEILRTPLPPARRRWRTLAAIAGGIAVLALVAWLFSRRAPAPAAPVVSAPPVMPATAPATMAVATPPAAPATAPATVAAETAAPQTAGPAPAVAREKPGPRKAPRSSRTVIATLTSGATFRDCPQCPLMVAVPAGDFQMGSVPGPGAAAWEGPAHRVTLAHPLAVARDEVTFGEWQACVAAKACPAVARGRGDGTDAAPAVNISWDEARQYVLFLTKTAGRTYRLPTEAEWEYAARAGTTSSRFWGDTRKDQCRYANAADRSTAGLEAGLPGADCDDGFSALAPAGALQANAFGLHHMAGNAWEWTQDCWSDDYSRAAADGSAADSAGCALRVIRGGSWRTKPESLRSANRGRSAPEHRGEDLGFRVLAE